MNSKVLNRNKALAHYIRNCLIKVVKLTYGHSGQPSEQHVCG